MVDASDALFEYDATAQAWRGHAAGMPSAANNFDLLMGRSYMIYLNLPGEFVFVGRPGADIRFVDFPGDPRVGASAADDDFRASLTLTPTADGVRLDWSDAEDLRAPLSPAEYAALYRVYRSDTRGGPYVAMANVTELTFTDTEATVGELYYMVVPVNGMGREGSSTFAAGIVWIPLSRGYNAFGLHFRSAEVTVTDFLTDQRLPEPGVLFAYDAAGQRWVGHSVKMPRGVTEFGLTLSEGYYVNVIHGGVVLVITGR